MPLATFTALVAETKPTVQAGHIAGKAAEVNAAPDTLSAEEKQTCQLMSISEEEFLKTKKQMG
jgi:phage I-like protein